MCSLSCCCRNYNARQGLIYWKGNEFDSTDTRAFARARKNTHSKSFSCCWSYIFSAVFLHVARILLRCYLEFSGQMK